MQINREFQFPGAQRDAGGGGQAAVRRIARSVRDAFPAAGRSEVRGTKNVPRMCGGRFLIYYQRLPPSERMMSRQARQ